MSKNSGLSRKVAVVAFHQNQVCLVTTKKGGRWVLPKGKMKRGRTAQEMALQEAWEEAGLVGTIRDDPVLTCMLKKSGRLYQLTTFVMDVSATSKHWPEKRDRQRRWFSPIDAVKCVHNDQLRQAIRQAVIQPAEDANWTQFQALLHQLWVNCQAQPGHEPLQWSLRLQQSPSRTKCSVILRAVIDGLSIGPAAASESDKPENGRPRTAAA